MTLVISIAVIYGFLFTCLCSCVYCGFIRIYASSELGLCGILELGLFCFVD